LIKFDILGLNTLNDIGNCIRLIKDRHGVDIDLYNIPEDDDAVYKDFHAGRTETVFQFNGAIPTKVCKEIKPNSIMDLAAITAACRPGTLYAEIENPDGTKSTLIDLWKKRKAGKMPVEYLHPSLEPILSSTSGIFLFQEQINRMFVECCGYSPEMADEMREIIGKKKKDKMDEIIPDVKDRLRKNGWSKNQIEAIISLCVAASNYVFNVSHSVTYSSTGYACMYLKHYYPLEWWTAILQNSTHKDLEANAKYFKKYLQTPNVNVSDVDFYIIDDKKKKIVYPLSMIKGVKNAASEIVMHKPFSSMEDFYNRVNKTKVNKKVFLAMIWAGAFDDMPEAGSGKIWEMRNRLYKFYHTLRKEKIEPEELSKGEVLKLESLSLCIGEPDVYSLYKQRYPCSSIVDVSRVHTFPNEATVSTIGIISGKREIVTKRGDPMCFVDLSNSENKISVTFFPKLFAEDKDKIIEGQILRVSGIVSRYNDRVSVVANKTNYYDIKNL
jgi:DNA polymerase-3 subunit alpha